MRFLAVIAAAAVAGTAVAQEPPAVVSPLEVKPLLAPVPVVGEGAPLLTVEDLLAAKKDARKEGVDAQRSSRWCSGLGVEMGLRLGQKPKSSMSEQDWLARVLNDEYQAQLRLMNEADRAAKATEAAVVARAGVAQNKAPQEAANSAELARQAAVKRYQAAQADMLEAAAASADIFELVNTGAHVDTYRNELAMRSAERANDGGASAIAIGRQYADLRISGLAVSEGETRGQPLIRVSGRVENPRRKPAGMPPLSISAVDQFGELLKTEVVQAASNARIPAGQSLPFAYDLRPKPGASKSVLVTFASDRRTPPDLRVGMYCDGGSNEGAVPMMNPRASNPRGWMTGR